MASTTTADLPGQAVQHEQPASETRRDFLNLVTGAFTAIGVVAISWTLIDSMNPAADVIAAGAPINIDVSKIEPGQQIIVRWRGDPILLVNRTPEMLKTLQEKSTIDRISDPNSRGSPPTFATR